MTRPRRHTETMISTSDEGRPSYASRITIGMEAFNAGARVAAFAFYDMALTTRQVAAIMEAMGLLVPRRVPLREAFWRWLVLWAAVVALALWGAS